MYFQCISKVFYLSFSVPPCSSILHHWIHFCLMFKFSLCSEMGCKMWHSSLQAFLCEQMIIYPAEVRITDASGIFSEVMGVIRHQTRLDSAFRVSERAYVVCLGELTDILAEYFAVLSTLLCSAVSPTVVKDAEAAVIWITHTSVSVVRIRV